MSSVGKKKALLSVQKAGLEKYIDENGSTVSFSSAASGSLHSKC